MSYFSSDPKGIVFNLVSGREYLNNGLSFLHGDPKGGPLFLSSISAGLVPADPIMISRWGGRAWGRIGPYVSGSVLIVSLSQNAHLMSSVLSLVIALTGKTDGDHVFARVGSAGEGDVVLSCPRWMSDRSLVRRGKLDQSAYTDIVVVDEVIIREQADAISKQLRKAYPSAKQVHFVSQLFLGQGIAGYADIEGELLAPVGARNERFRWDLSPGSRITHDNGAHAARPLLNEEDTARIGHLTQHISEKLKVDRSERTVSIQRCVLIVGMPGSGLQTFAMGAALAERGVRTRIQMITSAYCNLSKQVWMCKQVPGPGMRALYNYLPTDYAQVVLVGDHADGDDAVSVGLTIGAHEVFLTNTGV